MDGEKGYRGHSGFFRVLFTTVASVLLIIGLLAFGIDRLLFWFQRGLFPYRKDT